MKWYRYSEGVAGNMTMKVVPTRVGLLESIGLLSDYVKRHYYYICAWCERSKG